MKTYQTIIAAVAAGLTCSTSAFAALVPISVGQSQNPIGTTSVAGGASSLDTITSSLTGSDTGSFTATVYTHDSNNYFGLTGLTFVYSLSLTSGQVGKISLNDFFTGSVVLANDAGVAASYGNFVSGGTVGFGYFNDFTGSTTLIVQTAAAGFDISNALFQDGVQSDATSLAPVPEASTVMAGALMLLPFGMGAIRSLRKDRTA
jgi:hypothetical protein